MPRVPGHQFIRPTKLLKDWTARIRNRIIAIEAGAMAVRWWCPEEKTLKNARADAVHRQDQTLAQFFRDADREYEAALKDLDAAVDRRNEKVLYFPPEPITVTQAFRQTLKNMVCRDDRFPQIVGRYWTDGSMAIATSLFRPRLLAAVTKASKPPTMTEEHVLKCLPKSANESTVDEILVGKPFSDHPPVVLATSTGLVSQRIHAFAYERFELLRLLWSYTEIPMTLTVSDNRGMFLRETGTGELVVALMQMRYDEKLVSAAVAAWRERDDVTRFTYR